LVFPKNRIFLPAIKKFLIQYFSRVSGCNGNKFNWLGSELMKVLWSIFVGFCECRFGNLFGEAKVIESFGSGIEAGGDVAKSISRCHLGKDHADELLPALEMTNTLLCSISGDEPGECLAFDEFDHLGEYVATGVHRRGAWKMPLRSSNA
jgi:hypothetical protein